MFNGIVFSGLRFGIATLRMANEEDPSDYPGVRPSNPVLQFVAIPLRVESATRRNAG